LAPSSSLYISCALTFASVVPYTLLLRKLPIPGRKRVVKNSGEEEYVEALEQFERTNQPEDLRWVKYEQIAKINRHRFAKREKENLRHPWLAFEDDLPQLDRLQRVGHDDLKSIAENIEFNNYRWNAGDEKVKRVLRKTIKRMQEDSAWTLEEKHQLGEWMGSWLEHGGWMPPRVFPRFYKAAIMTSFPKLRDGGIRSESFTEDPTVLWQNMARLMRRTLQLEYATSKFYNPSRWNMDFFKGYNV